MNEANINLDGIDHRKFQQFYYCYFFKPRNAKTVDFQKEESKQKKRIMLIPAITT